MTVKYIIIIVIIIVNDIYIIQHCAARNALCWQLSL